MKVCGVLLLISLLGGSWAEKVKFNDYKVFTVKPETEDQLKALRNLENDSVASFDFWTSAKNVGQKSDIMVAPGQMDEFKTFLEENHLEASIKIEDVQKLVTFFLPTVKLSVKAFSVLNKDLILQRGILKRNSE